MHPLAQIILKFYKKVRKIIINFKLLYLDLEILKNVNRQLKKIFMLFGIDILLWLFTTLIDSIYYKHGFFPRMFLEFFLIIIISLFIAITLLFRRKIFCIIGGYTYLIAGAIGWLIKIIYICYLVFGQKVKENFEPGYAEHYWNFIIFLIQISLIFLRLYDCYLIKIMYKSLGFFERYNREKEHAEFIEKLGNKMGDDKNNDPNSNPDDICEIKFCEEDPDEYNENQI